jgi:hypothetical protein
LQRVLGALQRVLQFSAAVPAFVLLFSRPAARRFTADFAHCRRPAPRPFRKRAAVFPAAALFL